MKKEKFNFGFEVKAISDTSDDSGEEFYTLEGILSTDSIDQGLDIVETDAVLASVEKYGYPRFLHQHDGLKGMPLGKVVNLYAADGKIYMTAHILKGIKFNDDIMRKAAHGEYGGLSIGYKALDVDWDGQIRVIKKLKIHDASLVIFPMNEETEVTNVKSIEGLESLKDVEESLREHGYSKKSCEALISKIKTFALGDQEEKADDKGEPCSDDGNEDKEIQEAKEIKSALDSLIQEMKTTR